MTVTAAPILIYDGDCGFCTSTALKISRRFKVQATASPWQQLGEEYLRSVGLSIADTKKSAWWVDADGRTFRGHLAVSKALIAAQGWRRIIGVLILIPPFRWAGAIAYRVVARYRYRLPGSTAACRSQ